MLGPKRLVDYHRMFLSCTNQPIDLLICYVIQLTGFYMRKRWLLKVKWNCKKQITFILKTNPYWSVIAVDFILIIFLQNKELIES